MFSLIFIIHVLVCIMVTAIMWYLQVVHLPMLRFIGADRYELYYRELKMKNTLLFFPLFSLEIFTSVALLLSFTMVSDFNPDVQNQFFLIGFSLILLFILHLINFQMIRPLLSILHTDVDGKKHQRLIYMQWIRTLGWTLRLIILLSMIFTV
ncbi:MAG: hypothetical protein N2167_07350 [Flavobacteriales bacterium]|nr:hypothetical protein [Flavobacteriales bacterium]